MNIKTRKNALAYKSGIGITEEPDKPQDNGKAVELAKRVNRKQRVNSDNLERWK